jgi:hypothetical protein
MKRLLKKRVRKTVKQLKVPQQVQRAYDYAKEIGSRHYWVAAIDYSIHSSKPRFFVYNKVTGEFYAEKCAHGIGGDNRLKHDGHCHEVSNRAGSLMSNLGFGRMGGTYVSKTVGFARRIHGLSPTNNNMLSRGIVLHEGGYIPDRGICGRSQGCPAVRPLILRKIVKDLSEGAIIDMHFNGKHFVGKTAGK